MNSYHSGTPYQPNLPRFVDPYFIYCRKSSEAEDRQVLSLDSQTAELRELARRQGFLIAEVLVEARSAKAPGRPVFNAMMERLRRGEARGVLCWKLDRLARNPIDGGAVIWAMKEDGIAVVTPAQTFHHASDNTILMYIEFGMAQKYIEDLSKNVKRGLHAKAEHGWYPGLAPLGYQNDRFKEQGLRDIEKDPERFPLVRRMWDLMLTGTYSVPKIQRLANGAWGFRTRPIRSQGGKPLSLSQAYEIFSNPFYYGWFEYPRGSGQWFKGGHPPMVTEAEYDKVQVLLGRKGKPRNRQHEFAFTGLIRCGECERMITAEEKLQVICSACRQKFASRNRDACPHCDVATADMDQPTHLVYRYYHCTGRRGTGCTQGVVSGDELEAQISRALGKLEISERATTWALDALDQLRDRKFADIEVARESAERTKIEIEKRIASLIDLKTSPANADGILLSDYEYGLRRRDLLKQRELLAQRVADPVDAYRVAEDKVKAVLNIVCGVRSQFEAGDPATKKTILQSVGSNLRLSANIFSMEAKIPFSLVEEALSVALGDPEPVEPENGGAVPSWFSRDAFAIPLGCTQPDVNRTYQARKGSSPKDITQPAIRRLVNQLLRFFHENPDHCVSDVPTSTRKQQAEREAA